MPAMNTLGQLLACTPRATMHSVTDRQTDGWTDVRISRSYGVAVRSDKNVRNVTKNAQVLNVHALCYALTLQTQAQCCDVG